jgi:hypothetical protein
MKSPRARDPDEAPPADKTDMASSPIQPFMQSREASGSFGGEKLLPGMALEE